MTSREKLQDSHLAELHDLAAKASVPKFRLLSRDDLIDAIADGGGDREAAAESERPKRRRRRRRGAGGDEPKAERGSARESESKRDTDDGSDDTEEHTGVLDLLPQGHGFLRLGGLEPGEGDVYVSASQIKRCELRAGDEVSGPVRSPRRGERHPAIVRVEKVNGEEATEGREASFEGLTPIAPHRRIPLAVERDDILVRAAEVLTPLAYGQRVLVRAEPRSGRTTLLRGLVKAISAADDAPGIVVLLVDERPEEVTEWRRQAPEAEIAAATADLEAADQVRHAELALQRAKRRAERGEDVVFIVDSLTRLGVAQRDPSAIKPLFGAGRETEESDGGSLTVIATVLSGTDDGDGDAVAEAVETTENAVIALDASLAAAGILPAIDAAACAVSGEEALREESELAAVRRLRAELAGQDSAGAAAALRERIEASSSNDELLKSL